jgi:acetolactate synthase-1/2/3 large subunit
LPIGLEHAGRTLVDLLCAHGVSVVFGLPGGQTNALYDGIAHDDRIEHVDVLDERSAAYAADAYARLTGRVGVCDATVGPGAAKLPSGLAEAFNSSIPVLAIVSDLPRATASRRYRGATSQALDQEALLHPVTKWVGVAGRPEDLGPIVRRAFREATSGRPGPVAVIIPQDVLDGPPPGDPQAEDPHAAGFGRFPSLPAPPDSGSVAAISALIAGAQRPLVVIGGGANRAGIGAQVDRLAGASVAVATTLSGKGAADERAGLALGVLGALGNPAAIAAAAEADVLILAGTKWGSGTTAGWTLPVAGQRVAQIDIDPVELGRDQPVDAIACADAVATLASLDLSPSNRESWRARIAEIKAGWLRDRAALWSSAAVPIDPQRVMGELSRVITAEDVVIADASLSSGWVGSFIESGEHGPRTLFPRGLAGLGWALPAAIGAIEAGAPRVVAVMGDGAAPYAIGELATLARSGVPLLLVVLNNSSYGWIRWYRRVAFGRGWEEPDLPETRFADVATAYGLRAVRIDDPEALAEVFGGAIEGATLVEVVTSVWETPIDAHRHALEKNEQAEY